MAGRTESKGGDGLVGVVASESSSFHGPVTDTRLEGYIAHPSSLVHAISPLPFHSAWPFFEKMKLTDLCEHG